MIVKRKWHTPHSTIGELYVNDQFVCYTLEDTLRAWGIKVPSFTGLPCGTYKLDIRYSPKFKKDLPVIYTRKDSLNYYAEQGGISFKFALIHGGNSHIDTDGCILVGYNKTDDGRIYNSAEDEITRIVKNGERVLTLKNIG